MVNQYGHSLLRPYPSDSLASCLMLIHEQRHLIFGFGLGFDNTPTGDIKSIKSLYFRHRGP